MSLVDVFPRNDKRRARRASCIRVRGGALRCDIVGIKVSAKHLDHTVAWRRAKIAPTDERRERPRRGARRGRLPRDPHPIATSDVGMNTIPRAAVKSTSHKSEWRRRRGRRNRCRPQMAGRIVAYKGRNERRRNATGVTAAVRGGRGRGIQGKYVEDDTAGAINWAGRRCRFA